MKIISAEYVLPISSEPIEHGAVAIDGGRIVTVGKADDVRSQFPDVKADDFGRRR